MQLAQAEFEQVALGADRQERGRGWRRRAEDTAVERGAQRVGIVGFDEGQWRAAVSRAVTERPQHRAGKIDGAVKRGRIMPGLGTKQESPTGCAISEQREQRLRTDLADLVYRHRQDIGRQSCSEAGQRMD